jgi:hypothetical protein
MEIFELRPNYTDIATNRAILSEINGKFELHKQVAKSLKKNKG